MGFSFFVMEKASDQLNLCFFVKCGINFMCGGGAKCKTFHVAAS